MPSFSPSYKLTEGLSQASKTTSKYNHFRCSVVLISANTPTTNCASLSIQSYDLASPDTSLVLTVRGCFPTSPCHFLEFPSLCQKFEPPSSVPPNEYAPSACTRLCSFCNQDFPKDEDSPSPADQSLVPLAEPPMHISVPRLRDLLSCGSMEFRKVYQH
jgi:hypothetical protein